MKIIFYDHDVEEFHSMNIAEREYEYFESMLRYLNDVSEDYSSTRPLEIVAEERIMQPSTFNMEV